MKKHFTNLIYLLLGLPILFIGCQKSEVLEPASKTNPTQGNNALKSTIVYCGTPIVANLVDFEQTINPGTVTVGNDENKLYITYELSGDWWIQNATLYVGPASGVPGDMNPDGSGNFTPWYPYFPYYYYPWDFVQNHTFEIDLSTLPESFIVIAYSNSKNLVTNENKYIWGKSVMKYQGYYLEYTKKSCGPPPLGGCESSFAYGNAYATCFQSIPWLCGNDWGWTNGRIDHGVYTWPIYAKAEDCVTDDGILVGNVTINYTCFKAVITYHILEGYKLSKTHLFVGILPLPIYRWQFTTNPEHYPFKHCNLNGATTDTYSVCGLIGKIYVIAEAVVCDAD
jgi:hypothetical protein